MRRHELGEDGVDLVRGRVEVGVLLAQRAVVVVEARLLEAAVAEAVRARQHDRHVEHVHADRARVVGRLGRHRRAGRGGNQLGREALRVGEGGGELRRDVEGLLLHEAAEGVRERELRRLVVLLDDLGDREVVEHRELAQQVDLAAQLDKLAQCGLVLLVDAHRLHECGQRHLPTVENAGGQAVGRLPQPLLGLRQNTSEALEPEHKVLLTRRVEGVNLPEAAEGGEERSAGAIPLDRRLRFCPVARPQPCEGPVCLLFRTPVGGSGSAGWHTCWMHCISWPMNSPSAWPAVSALSSPLSVFLRDLYCTYACAQSGCIAARSLWPNFIAYPSCDGSRRRTSSAARRSRDLGEVPQRRART